MAGGAGGLGRAIQEHHQLKFLLVHCVHGHLEERAALVNYMVQRERAHEEEVVLTGIHHEVNINLVHDDCLPIWRVCCPQQLAVDLAPYHQGLAQVGQSDRQAKGTVFWADNSHVTEGDGLGPLFWQGNFGQDDSTHETVDNGSNEGLDDDKGHSTWAERGDCTSTIADSRLGLQGVEECSGESNNIVHTWSMVLGGALPRQVSIAAGNPVPQQAKNEPTEGERGNEEEEDKTPSDLHKGGPEVGQEGKMLAVFHVSIFNVAAPIFGHQSGPANSSLSQSVLDAFPEESKHFLCDNDLSENKTTAIYKHFGKQ